MTLNTQRTTLGAPEVLRIALQDAVARQRSVVIEYQAGQAEQSHLFLLFPQRLVERRGRAYVEGWSTLRPTRIRPWRTFPGRPGQHRHFRLDRIMALEPDMPRNRSIRAYAVHKIRTRGVASGICQLSEARSRPPWTSSATSSAWPRRCAHRRNIRVTLPRGSTTSTRMAPTAESVNTFGS
jgi:hypothetical protein